VYFLVALKNELVELSGTVKVCLYRTRPRLGGVREGMVEIKQTKVIYTEHESERGTRL